MGESLRHHEGHITNSQLIKFKEFEKDITLTDKKGIVINLEGFKILTYFGTRKKVHYIYIIKNNTIYYLVEASHMSDNTYMILKTNWRKFKKTK